MRKPSALHSFYNLMLNFSADRQPQRLTLPKYYDPDLQADVQPTNLTMIVAPTAIVGQWSDEIQRHAPSLRVLTYNVRFPVTDVCIVN